MWPGRRWLFRSSGVEETVGKQKALLLCQPTEIVEEARKALFRLSPGRLPAYSARGKAMRTIPLGVSPLKSSQLAYGCWRVAGTWNLAEVTPQSRAAGSRAIIAAFEAGYTLFDNADIYCRGEAERILGAALKDATGMRDDVLIATKGGIRPAGEPEPGAPSRYDFSASHIVNACEQSLRRLGVETIDIYM